MFNRFTFTVDDQLALMMTDEKHIANQHMVWVEGLSGLQLEITKQFRNDGMYPKDGIKEEIADIIIAINQIIKAYNLKVCEIQTIIDAKEAIAYYRLSKEV